MADVLLTPVTLDLATKVARRTYRKKILPIGTINYKGRSIEFNEDYLRDLVDSFSNEAYDQVPFVLATENNAHNELPERFRGELTNLELAADGLYGTIATNNEGAKILEDNPKLGVSARIVEALEKSDGRTFKRAIRHVLGTMDPRVTGLGPWQPVDLSDEADGSYEVVDLSAARYEEGTAMPKNTGKTITLDLANLTDEQFEILLAAAQDGEQVEDEFDEETGKRVVGHREDGTPILEGDEDDPEADGNGDDDGDGVADGLANSPTGQPTTDKVRTRTTTTKETFGGNSGADLSNVVDSETRSQVHQMRVDLANERWQTERRDLVQAGVPPFLLDLAEPLLSSPDTTTIDLSNADEPFNATDTVRKIINGVKGMVDLGVEIGHSVDLSETSDDDKALLDLWDAEYGR